MIFCQGSQTWSLWKFICEKLRRYFYAESVLASDILHVRCIKTNCENLELKSCVKLYLDFCFNALMNDFLLKKKNRIKGGGHKTLQKLVWGMLAWYKGHDLIAVYQSRANLLTWISTVSFKVLALEGQRCKWHGMSTLTA